ncbi:hypothetical protein JRO89_XS07G0117300 [Xanthoceras sorbifolium]|uniref:PWWP domain-containing protein n=1 Tax=Xanthoceras sorbifolium TaxID=99658 RepID=A0ABQ8HTJ2_9ROSI|nr:hypothetical protein JRO89_XS07G0117300 [Xanthoceras sorbifolium]
MRAKQDAGDKSHDGDGGGKKVKAKQLEGEVALGDLLWVKLYGDSWWPAQVFDEDAVSESSKPGYRPAQAVLVRLYGSYEYLYVDPIKCHSEFEMVLKQNNGCCREIFEKALDQELLHFKSGRPKRKASASTDCIHKKPKSNRPNANCKNFKQGRVHKTVEPNSPGAKEEEKSRTCRQDGVQKITSRHDEIQKTVKPNSCTGEEDTKSRTPKQTREQVYLGRLRN